MATVIQKHGLGDLCDSLLAEKAKTGTQRYSDQEIAEKCTAALPPGAYDNGERVTQRQIQYYRMTEEKRNHKQAEREAKVELKDTLVVQRGDSAKRVATVTKMVYNLTGRLVRRVNDRLVGDEIPKPSEVKSMTDLGRFYLQAERLFSELSGSIETDSTQESIEIIEAEVQALFKRSSK